jgi:hypothetical protein
VLAGAKAPVRILDIVAYLSGKGPKDASFPPCLTEGVHPKIGVDLRLSAADELFSRAFALGRHLSSAADERRGTPINWIG